MIFIKLDNLEEAQALLKNCADMGGTVLKQYLLPSRRGQKQWLNYSLVLEDHLLLLFPIYQYHNVMCIMVYA